MNRQAKLLLIVGFFGLAAAGLGEAAPRWRGANQQAAARGQVWEYGTYCSWSVPAVPAGVPQVDPRPLVWIVDGAGDLKGCSNAFREANLLAGDTMEVAVF